MVHIITGFFKLLNCKFWYKSQKSGIGPALFLSHKIPGIFICQNCACYLLISYADQYYFFQYCWMHVPMNSIKCIMALSLYQVVVLATVQHTELCVRDLPSSTQSVFPHSPLPSKLSPCFSHSLSLPPPVLSCRSACSSHSPNGNRQTTQHDSNNITTQRAIFVRVLAESGFK